MIRKFSILIAIALLSACASPPRGELQAARKTLADAYATGAAELAREEYEKASRALQNGEELYRQERYESAEKILSHAASLALGSIARTEEERLRIETEARKAEEERLAALKKAEGAATVEVKSPPPPKPKPKPKRKPTPPPPPPPPLSDYTVGEGETLWSIATREAVYEDALLWPLLYKANRDQIKDPRQIYPGQILTIPRKLTVAELEEARQEARDSGIYPPPSLGQEAHLEEVK